MAALNDQILACHNCAVQNALAELRGHGRIDPFAVIFDGLNANVVEEARVQKGVAYPEAVRWQMDALKLLVTERELSAVSFSYDLRAFNPSGEGHALVNCIELPTRESKNIVVPYKRNILGAYRFIRPMVETVEAIGYWD